jgi:WD40 repeat protein
MRDTSSLVRAFPPPLSQNRKLSTEYSWLTLSLFSVATVNSVSFGPEQLGLLVGCASSDGSVSIIRYHGTHIVWRTSLVLIPHFPRHFKEGQWNVQRFMAHHMGVNALAFAPVEEKQTSVSSSPLSFRMTNEHTPSAPALRFATGGCDNLIKIWRYTNTTQCTPAAPMPDIAGMQGMIWEPATLCARTR